MRTTYQSARRHYRPRTAYEGRLLLFRATTGMGMMSRIRLDTATLFWAGAVGPPGACELWMFPGATRACFRNPTFAFWPGNCKAVSTKFFRSCRHARQRDDGAASSFRKALDPRTCRDN